MKKIRTIITMLIASAIVLSFTSCDILAGMKDSLKDDFSKWWGDPAAEQAELSCGISHLMTVSGKLTYNNIECEFIELDPTIGLRGQFTAYNKKDGNPVYEYKGKFFYKENVNDLEKGELFIYVEWVWDTKDNKWSTPNGAFNNLRYRDNDKPYFKSENVNLTTQITDTIDATTQITDEEWEAEHDAMVKIIQQKHSGSSDITGLTEDNIFDPDERTDRFGFIKRFNNALNNPSVSVSYEKVNNVFTYVATIDGETLELMIFSDDELFFYPYETTKDDFALGMYSYNQASYYEGNTLDYTKNKAARKWIRKNYSNIGSLYDELFEKAATAKAEAKKKAEEEYEASKNN